MRTNACAPHQVLMLLVLLPFCAWPQGRIGQVTVAPSSQNVNAPDTRFRNENTGVAAPTANAGANAGNSTFNNTPLGIAAPTSVANATLTPTAVSGQGGDVNWTPVNVSDIRSASASLVSTYAPAINLPPSILAADELCLPINMSMPEQRARTMVESGAIFGSSYHYAMVKNSRGELVPGLITEGLKYPETPEYIVVVAHLYRRGPVLIRGRVNAGIKTVIIKYGQRWAVQTVTVASSTGGHITGSFANSSTSGGVGVASSGAVTDVVRLYHPKGTDCVVNKEYIQQEVAMSKTETLADCYTVMSNKFGQLSVVPYTGTAECRQRQMAEGKK